MELNQSTVRTNPCTIRQVRWSVPLAACPRCGSAAPRIWDVIRVAIDVGSRSANRAVRRSQLCLFHATRNVVKAVNEVVKQVRRSMPVPPPSTLPSLKGRHRDAAPTSDEHDPASERYRWRQARRAAGIAQAHALSPQIQSARALQATALPLEIGGQGPVLGNWMGGVDDVRIWNLASSPAEIQCKLSRP